MADQLISSSKRFVTLLLVFLQLFAPLAHAHLGGDDLTSGIHIHLTLHARQKAEQSPIKHQAETAGTHFSEVTIIEISTGLKGTIQVEQQNPSIISMVRELADKISEPSVYSSVVPPPLSSCFFLLPPSRAPPAA